MRHPFIIHANNKWNILIDDAAKYEFYLNLAFFIGQWSKFLFLSIILSTVCEILGTHSKFTNDKLFCSALTIASKYGRELFVTKYRTKYRTKKFFILMLLRTGL